MKSVLLGTVAALLYAGSAFAGTTVINLSPFCDVLTLVTQDSKKVQSASSFNTGCDDGIFLGATANIKKSLFLELGGFYDDFGTGTGWKIKLSYPLVTGGTWELDDTTDG